MIPTKISRTRRAADSLRVENLFNRRDFIVVEDVFAVAVVAKERRQKRVDVDRSGAFALRRFRRVDRVDSRFRFFSRLRQRSQRLGFEFVKFFLFRGVFFAQRLQVDFAKFRFEVSGVPVRLGGGDALGGVDAFLRFERRGFVGGKRFLTSGAERFDETFRGAVKSRGVGDGGRFRFRRLFRRR